MPMLHVERLAARVALDDPAGPLARAERAAAAGDESWNQWVDEHRRGKALIVCLEVTLEALDRSGERIALRITNRGVFLEKDPQPPNVEQQVEELASKDFPSLARELARRGHQIDDHFLSQMYVHVELADDVRDSLEEAGGQTSRVGLPGFDAGVAEPEGPREL